MGGTPEHVGYMGVPEGRGEASPPAGLLRLRLGWGESFPNTDVLPDPLSRRTLLRVLVAGVIGLGTPRVPGAEGEHPSERKLVETYKPKVEGNIDDVKIDAGKLLLGIPGVVGVERSPPKEKPSCRIVHLLDWHWISKEDFVHEQDLMESLRGVEEDFIEKREDAIVHRMGKGGLLILGGGHNLSDNVPPDCEYLRVETKAYRESGAIAEGAKTEEEHRARYGEFLREVEAVQTDQRVILRCLARHHGLRHIYQAGPHVLLESLFQDQVQAVKEYGNDPLFRETRLKIGAAGQLLAGGVLEEVRAADDFSLVLLEGTRRKEK